MVFGTKSPLAGNPNSTMMFGAPSPVAPAAKGNQTMVFGTPAATSAPPPAAPASQAGKPNQTMVFGTAAANTPASAPAHAAPKANQTMVFGTAAAQAPAQPPVAAPKASQTMVFGTGAAAPKSPSRPGVGASAPARSSVPTDDEVTAVPGGEPPKNQTMMFGRAPASLPVRVTPGEVVAAGYAGDEPRESTVRVDVESMMDRRGEGTPPQAPRHDRTQRYAMNDGADKPPAAAEERHNRTVLFAMNPAQDGHTASTDQVAAAHEPDPASTLPPDASDSSPGYALPEDAPSPNQTIVYGSRAASVPTVQAPAAPDASPVSALFDSEPDLPTPHAQSFQLEDAPLTDTARDLEAAPSVDLPPEPFAVAPTEPDAGQVSDEEALALRQAAARRTSIAVAVFLVIALVLALVLAWYVFGARLASSDGDVHQQTQDALTSLRRDDLKAQTTAVQQLQRIAQEHPTSIEALSALVVARACIADDARASADRQKLEAAERAREEDTAEDKSPALKAMRSAQARHDELAEAVRLLELAVAAAPEPTTPEKLAIVRARAFAAAVQGSTNAIALAEEFRQKSQGPDSWGELALPEYAVNGGASLDEALSQLETLEHRDTTFLRAYALAARLHLIRKDSENAGQALDTLLSLNPEHDTGRSLQAWLRNHRAD